MDSAEKSPIPRQDAPADVVEYGPEVPLAVRLEHERELMLSR